MTDNCKKTCNKCRCPCCNYKVRAIIIYIYILTLIDFRGRATARERRLQSQKNVVKWCAKKDCKPPPLLFYQELSSTTYRTQKS